MDFCTDSRVVADDIINTFSHIIKAPGFQSGPKAVHSGPASSMLSPVLGTRT